MLKGVDPAKELYLRLPGAEESCDWQPGGGRRWSQGAGAGGGRGRELAGRGRKVSFEKAAVKAGSLLRAQPHQ